MNRGSVLDLRISLVVSGASMRPRFMNRGSSGPGRDRPALLVGFNEAPIHESGKSADTCGNALTLVGFNEAPIHESGK